MNRGECLKHLSYETLLRLWPMSKGKTRWLRLVSDVLRITPYGAFKPKVVGPYKLRLDPGDSNDRLFYFDIMGHGYSLVISSLVQPGDCVIDVGANVGHFSAVCSQFTGNDGTIHAIEANPSLFDRLLETTSEVPSGPIHVQHAAVWRSSGMLSFNIAAESSGWSSIIPNDTFQTAYTVEVVSITLDEFVEREQIERVRMLKLDIEGAETDALLGGSKLLASGNLDYVLVEADPYRLKAYGHTGRELAELMERKGYLPACTIQGNKIKPIGDDTRIPGVVAGDHLYVREAIYEPTLAVILKC